MGDLIVDSNEIDMKLSFDEIKDWAEFEDLVAAYFTKLKGDNRNHPAISDVFIEPSGKGPDGGRDILLTITTTDGIINFYRKWVVQCKFYEKSVGKQAMSTINIPTLIHEYGADEYLLVCKNGVTSGVSNTFENLRKNCIHQYQYLIWTGNEFLGRIFRYDDLTKLYFPKFYKASKK